VLDREPRSPIMLARRAIWNTNRPASEIWKVDTLTEDITGEARGGREDSYVALASRCEGMGRLPCQKGRL
jgi:hypothetical protein